MVYRENYASPTSVSVINQAFAWMFGGLLLTALASFAVESSNSLANLILNNNIIFFGLIIVELALVFFLSIRIQKLSFGAALFTFLVYSLLNGLTISGDIFHLYCQFDCFRVRHLSTYFRHHGVDRVHDKEGSHFDWQPGSHGFDRGDSCFAGEPFPEERDYESRNLIPGRRDFRRFDGF